MKTKTYAEYKKEQRGRQQSNSNCGSSTPMNNKPVQLAKYVSSPSNAKKNQLTPPGSLGTLTKATYDRLKQQSQQPQQPLHSRRMGPTTSALVRPAPLFSRPPPGAALRVMPPKKRVKLDEDDDDVTILKKATELTNKSSSVKTKSACIQGPYLKGKDKFPERTKSVDILKKQFKTPPNKSKHENVKLTGMEKNKNKIASKGLKSPATPQKSFLSQRSQLLQRSQLQRSPVSPLPHISPKSSITTKSNRSVYAGKRQLAQKQPLLTLDDDAMDVTNTEQTKQSTFLGVKFKRMKKANIADQIKRTKEGKLDLMTPDSILTSVHIKDLLTEKTFALLPPAYQYQLLILLPECDREVGSDSALRLSKHALNNEFFSRSCQEFKDKLMDGEFNSDIIQRAKHEVEINNRIDPWKAKFFEPVYGASSLGQSSSKEANHPPLNLKVVESSWASFLKFAENTTDDFEEALVKMQVAVKAAHEKQLEKEKEELEKRDEQQKQFLQQRQQMQLQQQQLKLQLSPQSPRSEPNSPRSASKYSPFRNSSILKAKNMLRAETAAKEKSRKAVKKAQLLQRKKALDKQLKDAKAKILEEARSSSRKEETDPIKSKLLATSLDCSSRLLTSNVEGTINHLNHISAMNSVFPSPIECKPTGSEASTVINLCDSNALKNLIKNSDTATKQPPLPSPAAIPATISPSVGNSVAQNKHGPVRKRTGSRIMKGPSTFLTNSDGSCPCDLKSMVMCVQCETFWHGDSINGEQLCVLCT